ncbi:hypothetical protein ACVWWG_001593 [Bradyrhizobium sp. LB7.2]
MTKKISVPTPENRTATLGSNPISSGAMIVEPDIATQCWRPETTVWPSGNRSSGMITPEDFSVQRGK